MAIPNVFVRSPYNYDVDKASNDSSLICEDESLAIQSQREESDINFIVKRFGLTGELPSGVKAPQYGDFTDVTDYQTALNAVMAADEAFMRMPADIRSRFNNDAKQFVDFCSDEKNIEEMKKMGLIVEKEGTQVPVPSEQQVVQPVVPAP